MSKNRFYKNKIAIISLCFLFFIAFMAVFAPWVSTHGFDEQNINEQLQNISAQHWFGTDSLGRDLYSRIIYGARMSLSVGVITALISLTFGTLMGAIAGWKGGWVDHLLMRFVDVFYIFPSILIAILLTVIVGRGFWGILLALGLTSWVTQARLVRSQVMQAKQSLYVESARAIGVRSYRIVFMHILPNILGPIIVSLTFQIPTNIMSESFLSFIGLGLQPPYSSWGTLANEGFRAMKSYPHLIIWPGFILFLTLMAFNYLGDGIRDALDPKTKYDLS